MASTGIVQIWHRDEGWGVLESEDTPGGCWAHFSAIAGDGFRALLEDETVDFEWERPRGGQDGYVFRATTVERHQR